MRFKRSKQPSTVVEDRSPEVDPLLQKKINELNLKLEGTTLERLVAALERECVAAGLRKLKPVCYLSEEWGVPDGIPVIGIPYYLADEKLKKSVEDVVEADTEDEILSYLRHEMGHAFNYAYRLMASEEWAKLFGPPSRPYIEEYQPEPFSREFVRHIPGWYAQKHPDEDFAETFAVWLTPGSDWKARYAGSPAEKKLEYVGRVVAKVGDTEPEVKPSQFTDVSVEGMTYTVGEHLQRFRDPSVEVPPYFDGDLRDLFCKAPPHAERESAGTFLRRHRRMILKRVNHWTGVREGVIRSLVDHLAERAGALGLVVDPKKIERTYIDVIAYVTALCMNYLYKGAFFPGAGTKR